MMFIFYLFIYFCFFSRNTSTGNYMYTATAKSCAHFQVCSFFSLFTSELQKKIGN